MQTGVISVEFLVKESRQGKKIVAVAGAGMRAISDIFALAANTTPVDNSFRGGSRGKGGKTKYRRE
ncbi:MAG: hypothetical protein GY787_12700 [Alteromonadales bacterium]|nr:hypothetical protein [Alteromonadales bacterium]